MKIPFVDIESTFDFVASAPPGENSALLNRLTGESYFLSEYGDSDEIPEDAYDSEDWVDVPHFSELDLGRELAFSFVEARAPGEVRRVADLFRGSGAWRRFKGHLEHLGLLQDWFDFEAAARERAILAWCEEEGIEVEGGPGPDLTVLPGRPVAGAERFLIGETASFRTVQAAGYRIPGYLIVEDRHHRTRLADLSLAERTELASHLAAAERVLDDLVKPERVYVLRFGEEVPAIHFHVVPRTKSLVEAYLAEVEDAPPYRGAAIMDWLWKNHQTLEWTDAEIAEFVAHARSAWSIS